MSDELTDGRWVALIPVAEIEAEDVVAASHGGHDYAVYECAGDYFVTDAICTHAHASLCDGYLDGHTIECPLHQGCFDIRSGAATGAPATEALRTYACRVEGDMLHIRL